MAKTSETIITLTDDLDGSKADRTISFAYDGTSYEIELSKKNAAAFERSLSPYVKAARRVRGASRPSGKKTSKVGRREELSRIRAWALEQGMTVSPRGRISSDVIAAFEAAQ